jgi:hypothetical protein
LKSWRSSSAAATAAARALEGRGSRSGLQQPRGSGAAGGRISSEGSCQHSTAQHALGRMCTLRVPYLCIKQQAAAASSSACHYCWATP